MNKPWLVIMVKEPQLQQVKTRLGSELGMVQAAWWFRHQCRRLIAALSPDQRWRLVLAVTPDNIGLHSRVWPSHILRLPQGHGDLGQRMTRIFAQAPPGASIIIGADTIGVTPARIARAFHTLNGCDAIFSPTADGGYWLVGLRRQGKSIPRGFLQNVRWSSSHALVDSLLSLKGFNVHIGEELNDVDTLADLQASILFLDKLH